MRASHVGRGSIPFSHLLNEVCRHSRGSPLMMSRSGGGRRSPNPISFHFFLTSYSSFNTSQRLRTPRDVSVSSKLIDNHFSMLNADPALIISQTNQRNTARLLAYQRYSGYPAPLISRPFLYRVPSNKRRGVQTALRCGAYSRAALHFLTRFVSSTTILTLHYSVHMQLP